MFFRHRCLKVAMSMGLVLLVVSLACDGLGGECHDSRTGKVLSEIEDANGKLWSVEKHSQSIKVAGQDMKFCAVPIEAATQDRKFTGQSTIGWRYLFHPETGERIEVDGAYRGMRTLRGYEWY